MKALLGGNKMKNDRNMFGMQMMPNNPGMFATNGMMFPNYMNDNYTNLDNRVSSLEKKVKVLENRISRLETPYQNTNTQNYQTPQSGTQYQATQNDGTNYNGEMYMM